RPRQAPKLALTVKRTGRYCPQEGVEVVTVVKPSDPPLEAVMATADDTKAGEILIGQAVLGLRWGWPNPSSARHRHKKLGARHMTIGENNHSCAALLNSTSICSLVSPNSLPSPSIRGSSRLISSA